MKVLCLDGPERGKIHDLRDNIGTRFIFPSVTTGHNIVYYIHRFQVAGLHMRIASVHLYAEDIRPDDMYEFVVSDLAKQAAIE